MKASGNTKPNTFTIINRDGIASITFREAITESAAGEETTYTWDEYTIQRKWYPNLYKDIKNNYEPWKNAAKAEEERKIPIDEYQLRADVDYLMITQTAMMGISLMSLDAASDPTVLDLSWKYYPARWDEAKLRTLVSMQKLTASDFQSITGKPYETEVIG